MPWVRFTDDFDWWFKPLSACRAYRKGAVRLVTTPCARLAKAKSKAVAATPEEIRDAKGGRSEISAPLPEPGRGE